MAKYRLEGHEKEAMIERGDGKITIGVLELEKGNEVDLDIVAGEDYQVITTGVELSPVGKVFNKFEGGYNAILLIDGEAFLTQNIDWE